MATQYRFEPCSYGPMMPENAGCISGNVSAGFPMRTGVPVNEGSGTSEPQSRISRRARSPALLYLPRALSCPQLRRPIYARDEQLRYPTRPPPRRDYAGCSIAQMAEGNLPFALY